MGLEQFIHQQWTVAPIVRHPIICKISFSSSTL